MKRIPEPDELMDDAAQAKAYADTDFAEARARFVQLFEGLVGDGFSGQLLDLGCGPADIPIALADRHPAVSIDAVDGAEAMLAHARTALAARPGLEARIRLLHSCLPSAHLAARHYDAILSNSLLHHLPSPATLWSTVRRCARPGAAVLVMDLMRPADEAAVNRLVALHADGAPPLLRRDFHNSLYAAYEPDEVRDQLTAAGLAGLRVEAVSDRHLAVSGWLPR